MIIIAPIFFPNLTRLAIRVEIVKEKMWDGESFACHLRQQNDFAPDNTSPTSLTVRLDM